MPKRTVTEPENVLEAPAGVHPVLEGSPALAGITLKRVADLLPYARNARLHPRAQVDAVKASMQKFGWTIPVLVDENSGVIAGHARLIAAAELGIEEAPTLTAHGWSDAKKRAYILADNKLTERGGWDWAMVSAELKDIQAEGFDLALTGFEAFEIEPLLNAEWSPPAESTKGPADNQASGQPHGATDGHSILVTIEQYEVIAKALARVRSERSAPRMSDGAALVALAESAGTVS